jgi:hypothetical protein
VNRGRKILEGSMDELRSNESSRLHDMFLRAVRDDDAVREVAR